MEWQGIHPEDQGQDKMVMGRTYRTSQGGRNNWGKDWTAKVCKNNQEQNWNAYDKTEQPTSGL